jgi:hypothetical protein
LNRKSFLGLIAGLVAAPLLPKRTLPGVEGKDWWQFNRGIYPASDGFAERWARLESERLDPAIQFGNRDVARLHSDICRKILERPSPFKDILDGGTFEIKS